ncbi:hypothetical protein SDC9_164022 [bioreactor metagenome]|uniref:Uncharacterized protein n=1 Tax=bioreactor metagenome TaxID=1076179 RepID=A0A645FQH0_9ZZZZ
MDMTAIKTSTRLLIGFPGIKVDAGIALHSFSHRDTLPLAAQIDLLALVSEDLTAAGCARDMLEKLLCQIHHRIVIGICLIEFNGREFRVMLGIHSLVSENTAYFVYFIKAADNQAL